MKDTKVKTIEFNQLLIGFERELMKENKPEEYRTENLSYLKEFLEYAEEKGATTLKMIEQTLTDRYILYLQQERKNYRTGGPLGSSTISKHRGAIQNFLKYLDAEELSVNAIHFKKIKIEKAEPATVLSHEEIEWLYAVTDTSYFGFRDRAMLALYYGGGLRRIEGVRLLLTDIDFSRGRIRIRKTKTHRERYVVMSPKVQDHLEEYIHSARELYIPEGMNYDELFIGERGTPIRATTLDQRIKVLWKRVKNKYGTNKHITLHDLRHTIGTHLYIAGMSLETVALMLGHRSLESTQIYIHAAEELKSEKLEKTTETELHEQI